MTANSEDISDFGDVPSAPKNTSRGKFTLLHLLGLIGIIGLLIGLFLPASRSARPAARRAMCVSNLRQIALALHEYQSAYKVLPPAYTVDAAGKPLHSWRTLILPYLDQQSLYEMIDLSKPWNDPANQQALDTPLAVYRCPERNSAANTTAYLAIVTPDGCFLPDRSRQLNEITDDHKSTLMLIEVSSDQAVPWMAPIDATESLVMGLGPQSKLNHNGGMNAAFLDGSVRFLKANTPATQRRAIISISGDDDNVVRDL